MTFENFFIIVSHCVQPSNHRNMKSVLTSTVTSIEHILTVEGESTNKKNLLIRDLKNRISHMNLQSKLIFLNECLANKVAPKEIMSLAKRTVSEVGSNSRQIKEERRILKLRILEKNFQITDSKVRMNQGIRQAI